MTHSSFTQPVARRTRRHRAQNRVAFRPRLERLEDRAVPSTVTNLADSGPGSLRDAIANTPAGGTVDFQSGLTGTILLTSGELVIANDLMIDGPGAGVLTVSGNNASRVFDITGSTVAISGLTVADGFSGGVENGGGIANNGNLSLTDLVVTGNSSTGYDPTIFFPGGGGIFNSGTLTLTNSSITGNSVTNSHSSGGGIDNQSQMTITDCVVSGNTSAGDGGGIADNGTLSVTSSTFSDNSAGNGGGVLDAGPLTISNSTFSNNSGGASGGGICDFGNMYNIGNALVVNCTFNANTATNGGAISNTGGNISISSSTISGNTASADGGGIFGNVFQLANTIVAGNHAASSPDLSGTPYEDQGHNLIGDGTGGSGFDPTDLVGTSAQPIDPKLGPLQDNGGPTQTMALLLGSPAIDAGDNSFNPGLYDQRGPGYPRIVNGTIDIGAFESHILAVQNTNDSGAGSLRQAILDANSIPGGNTITFLPGVTGTIYLDSALPDLSSNIDLEGPGALSLTVQPVSGSSFGIFTVENGAIVTLAGLTIANGVDATGGSILNSGGALTISDCTITGNAGSGIDNALGTLTVSDCTVANNSGSNGAGVLNAATLTLSNSTIAGNSATGTGSGGGIDNTGTLTVSSCTIANNSGGAGGGVFNGGTGTATIYNTLIAQNQAPTGPDVAGAFVSQGHNLIGDGTGGSGFAASDLVGTLAQPIDPKLGPLQNNGGPMPTLALLAGSPAIDAGANASPPGVYDQRGVGFSRIANGTIDIGAFEFQVSPPTIFVLNTNDAGAGSLRQALLDANALPGDTVITFAPGVTGTINLVTILPDLSSNIDLEGPGSANLTVENTGVLSFHIFHVVNGATVTLAGMTISNGLDAVGAGILNDDGTLTVDNCAFSDNGFDIGSYSWENLTVNNCSFRGISGGGINIVSSELGTGGVGTVDNSTFSSGTGTGISLGGGTLTVNNCSFTGGLGISNSGTLFVNNCSIQSCDSGGMSNAGTATIDQCTIANNQAGDGGGIYTSGTLTITNSTVADNLAKGTWVIYDVPGLPPAVPTSRAVGGGIWNSGTLTVADCTVAANTASQDYPQDTSIGGGIASTVGGTVTLVNTILAQNQSPTGPDGIGSFVSQGYNLIGDGTGMTGLSNGVNGDLVGTSTSPINPLLAPLGDYGGPTQTLALLPGSPALGMGGPTTTLAQALNDSATSVSVANAPALGVVPNSTVLLIDGEQMLVVGILGNTLTVQRGYAGTTAADHAPGASVFPATDQRGLPRLRQGQIDIGALQSGGFMLTTSGGHQSAALYTLFSQPLEVTVTANNPGEPVAGGILTFSAPSSGPSAALGTPSATVNASGSASTTATATGTTGTYSVLVSAGDNFNALFPLTNVPAPNPNTAFVIALYQEVLDRAPDAAGLSAWVAYLQGGVSRQAVVQGFWDSLEHLGLEVDQLYATYLHRAADPAGRAAWVADMMAGMSETQVAWYFLTSPEYAAAHPTMESYVQGLYADVNGRAPDPAGLAFWVAFGQTNMLDRAALPWCFLDSTEKYLQLIDACYLQYLHRPADPAGQAAYLAELEQGLLSAGDLDCVFLASNEFFNLASLGQV